MLKITPVPALFCRGRLNEPLRLPSVKALAETVLSNSIAPPDATVSALLLRAPPEVSRRVPLETSVGPL